MGVVTSSPLLVHILAHSMRSRCSRFIAVRTSVIKVSVELVNGVCVTTISVDFYFITMIKSDFKLTRVTIVLNELSFDLSCLILEPQYLFERRIGFGAHFTIQIVLLGRK